MLKTFLESNCIAKQHFFSTLPLILTLNFDLSFGWFLASKEIEKSIRKVFHINRFSSGIGLKK